jgi:hypothetical protein
MPSQIYLPNILRIPATNAKNFRYLSWQGFHQPENALFPEILEKTINLFVIR